MSKPEKEEKKMTVTVPDDLARIYANFAHVIHTDTEFFLDLMLQAPPNMENPTVVARLVVSPVFVKRLIQCLQSNLERFEKTNGTVPLPENAVPMAATN